MDYHNLFFNNKTKQASDVLIQSMLDNEPFDNVDEILLGISERYSQLKQQATGIRCKPILQAELRNHLKKQLQKERLQVTIAED